MKLLHKIILLLLVFLSFYGCGNNTKKDNAKAEETLNEQLGSDSTRITKNEKLTYVEAYNRALTLWKIPFEERDLKTSFGNAHVIMSGHANGEPLVLLHGMNASSTMWYPNVKAFSEKHRVYAIDFLLEPGKSLCHSDINSTDEIVKWYFEIFDQLKLNKFSIVGASRGGWLAMNIALHSQKRINKIALLSPAQTFIWIRPKSKIVENLVYSVSPKRKRLRSVLETMTFDIDKLNQVYINQYFIATEEATMNKCLLQMQPFSEKQLKSLRIPVLVLIGDNDIINNNKSIRLAEELIPNVQTGTIKNAGHFLSVDQPEIVNVRVLDFLDQDNLNTKRKK